eukprot:126331-Rhodomonas_salina.2
MHLWGGTGFVAKDGGIKEAGALAGSAREDFEDARHKRSAIRSLKHAGQCLGPDNQRLDRRRRRVMHSRCSQRLLELLDGDHPLDTDHIRLHFEHAVIILVHFKQEAYSQTKQNQSSRVMTPSQVWFIYHENLCPVSAEVAELV